MNSARSIIAYRQYLIVTLKFRNIRLRFWFPGTGSGVVVWSGIRKESRAQLRTVEKHRELNKFLNRRDGLKDLSSSRGMARRTLEFDGL